MNKFLNTFMKKYGAIIMIFAFCVALTGCDTVIKKESKSRNEIVFNSEYLCKSIKDVYSLLNITESDVGYSGNRGKVYLNDYVEIEGISFREYLLYGTYKQYEDAVYGMGYESTTNDKDKAKKILKGLYSQFNEEIGEPCTYPSENCISDMENIYSVNGRTLIEEWHPDNENVLYITLKGDFSQEDNIAISAEYHLRAVPGNETDTKALDDFFESRR